MPLPLRKLSSSLVTCFAVRMSTGMSRGALVLADLPEDREAVHLGHHEVEDQRVRDLPADVLERFAAVARHTDLVPLRSQDVQELHDGGLAVLDEEQAAARPARADAGRGRGRRRRRGLRAASGPPATSEVSRTVNVDPSPRTLSTSIPAPSSSAYLAAMARPRPVPPYLRDVPSSACRNSSKIVWSWSSAMPMPLSLTATRSPRPLVPHATCTRPRP